MPSTHRNTSLEMPFEIALVRDELINVDPDAAMMVNNFYAHFNHNADDTDDEDVIWSRQSANIVFEPDFEASTPDNPTPRRAMQPSGHGWENTAMIAAGEEINRRIYGDSIDAIENTSLVEPELESSGVPQSQSALRRAQEAAAEYQAILQRVQDSDDFMRTEQRQRRLEARTGAALHALHTHRSSGERQRLEQELVRRAEEFAERDLDAWTEWNAFCNVARRCTSSVARRLQITQWYTGRPRHSQGIPVPARLLRQIRRVELYHTVEARLLRTLINAEVQDGSRPDTDARTMMRDDDNYWSGNARSYTFGYEAESIKNGFSDYQPRGEGPRLVRHIENNLLARQTRLYHAAPGDVGVLTTRLRRFADRAARELRTRQDAIRALGGVHRASLDRVQQSLQDCRSRSPEIQAGNDEEDDGEESDASEVRSIRTFVPIAAGNTGR